jgi:hypothetical protein
VCFIAFQVFYVGPKWGGLWRISSSRKRRHSENGFTTEAVMTAQKLEKAEWSPFFKHLSKTLTGSQAEIDVGSLALGDQVQANWVALIGLVYDPKDDLVEVTLEGLDHLIHNPRDIYIEQGNGSLASIEITDAEGARQIIKLKYPLMLPAPRS